MKTVPLFNFYFIELSGAIETSAMKGRTFYSLWLRLNVSSLVTAACSIL